MIVYQSSQSKDDVFAIASYIYKDNQTAALPFLDCIEETYTMLGDFLKMGHKPYFDFIEGLLTITVKSFPSYSIFYRVLEDHLRIERVADGRRDLRALFALQK